MHIYAHVVPWLLVIGQLVFSVGLRWSLKLPIVLTQYYWIRIHIQGSLPYPDILDVNGIIDRLNMDHVKHVVANDDIDLTVDLCNYPIFDFRCWFWYESWLPRPPRHCLSMIRFIQRLTVTILLGISEASADCRRLHSGNCCIQMWCGTNERSDLIMNGFVFSTRMNSTLLPRVIAWKESHCSALSWPCAIKTPACSKDNGGHTHLTSEVLLDGTSCH